MSRKRVYHCNKHQNVLWLRAAIGRDINKLIIVKLLIDTGASYSVLPIPILQSIACNIKQPLSRKNIITANGSISVPIVAVPLFNCMGVKRKSFPVVGLNLPARSFTDGLLGMDFLIEINAVIDVAKAEIKLSS